MSLAPSTSAHASANERKIVFRAGTYVIGIPCPSRPPRAPWAHRCRGQRRPAKDAQIDRRACDARHADRCGNPRAASKLPHMPLPIRERQRISSYPWRAQSPAPSPSPAPAQQHHRSFRVAMLLHCLRLRITSIPALANIHRGGSGLLSSIDGLDALLEHALRRQNELDRIAPAPCRPHAESRNAPRPSPARAHWPRPRPARTSRITGRSITSSPT
jgi:hypothetical protein